MKLWMLFLLTLSLAVLCWMVSGCAGERHKAPVNQGYSVAEATGPAAAQEAAYVREYAPDIENARVDYIIPCKVQAPSAKTAKSISMPSRTLLTLSGYGQETISRYDWLMYIVVGLLSLVACCCFVMAFLHLRWKDGMGGDN